MSNKVNKIYTWMSEITGESPKAFNEFFYSDIMDYVFPDNYFLKVQELSNTTK
jgi:hypothetical protein